MARRTFQELIAANKRNSFILIAGMFALLGVIGAVFGGAYGDPRVGLIAAGGVAGIVFLISWFSGGDILMAVNGAHEIRKSDAPQLWNVVEEMAIAAGLPMPRVFIIDSDAPNAFATGVDPQHAAVAITTGLLEKLKRDEVQGVMAHELAHVRNFDIRYSMLMAVMAGAIVLLSDVFLRSLWFSGGSRRRSNDRDGGGAIMAVFMLIGIVLAILSPVITALIQLAMSRQREYLADASAVEFSRNPEGLASALEKLASDKSPMEANKATAALYIVNPKLGLRGGGTDWFSTHPPIQERIVRLRALN